MRPLLALGAVAAAASIAHAAPARPQIPIAVEFVINGQEIAMGNDQIEEEGSPARYPGMLLGFEHAMNRTPLALPAGSVAGVVTYADHGAIRWPLSDAKSLSSTALGEQKDYFGAIGIDVVSGIELGLAELGKVDAQHKFLVVIGDGTDTNMEAAKAELKALRHDAERQGVEPIAIVYKNALSDEATVVTELDPHAMRAMTVENVWLYAVQRIQVTETTIARAPEHPTCGLTSWLVSWRWQLAVGSVLALFAMGGIWFVRRERL
ncbi:MAG TPA: hypothetical protein VGM39_04840 [Kofleriaceae bacterium]|jgi:hypothetical protein